MSGFKKPIAAPIATPSPPVGEGITAGQHKLDWVRGSVSEFALLKQPLTRLRFAIADAKHRRRFKDGGRKAAYASPTRGEGKRPASGRRQSK